MACAAPAYADKPAADAAGDAPAATATPADQTPADSLTQKKNLEGHIQDEAVRLESGLKDLNKTLHHLKRSAWDIFIETQRQNMVVVGEPDVIGPIIIPAIPSPTGMMNVGGLLPPRKKFLDYFMSQINDLYKMTQTEVAALQLPDDATDDGKAILKTVTDAAAALPDDISALAEVTAGPELDNMNIARAAQQMQDHVQAIEKATKKLDEEAKREVSKAKRDMRDIDKAIKKEAQGK